MIVLHMTGKDSKYSAFYVFLYEGIFFYESTAFASSTSNSFCFIHKSRISLSRKPYLVKILSTLFVFIEFALSDFAFAGDSDTVVRGAALSPEPPVGISLRFVDWSLRCSSCSSLRWANHLSTIR